MRKKSYRKAIISTMLATSMVVGTVEEAGVLFSQKVIAATDEEDFETAGDSISPTKEVTDSAEYDIEPTAHATDPAEYDIEPTAKATDPAEKNRDFEKDVVDNPIVDDEDDMDSE